MSVFPQTQVLKDLFNDVPLVNEAARIMPSTSANYLLTAIVGRCRSLLLASCRCRPTRLSKQLKDLVLQLTP